MLIQGKDKILALVKHEPTYLSSFSLPIDSIVEICTDSTCAIFSISAHARTWTKCNNRMLLHKIRLFVKEINRTIFKKVSQRSNRNGRNLMQVQGYSTL